MSSIEPLTLAILSKAVDLLFDQVSKILEERRKNQTQSDAHEAGADNSADLLMSQRENVLSWKPNALHLTEVHSDIAHCIEMIAQYESNKKHVEQAIAHYGGFVLAPTHLRNELTAVEKDVDTWAQKLKKLIEYVYNREIKISTSA